MAGDSKIAALVQARLGALKMASETRDADAVASWYTKDAVFEDPINGRTVSGPEELRNFYAQIYAAIPTFRIVKSKCTENAAEFVAAEMTCEGESAFDMPGTPVKAGETFTMVGVSLYWWRWEGPGDEWDGSLSDESIGGWKISRETVYMSYK